MRGLLSCAQGSGGSVHPLSSSSSPPQMLYMIIQRLRERETNQEKGVTEAEGKEQREEETRGERDETNKEEEADRAMEGSDLSGCVFAAAQFDGQHDLKNPI